MNRQLSELAGVDPLFPPSEAAEARTLTTAAQNDEMYARSISDPNGFWAEQAERIDWIKAPTKIKNTPTFHLDSTRRHSTTLWGTHSAGAVTSLFDPVRLRKSWGTLRSPNALMTF